MIVLNFLESIIHIISPRYQDSRCFPKKNMQIHYKNYERGTSCLYIYNKGTNLRTLPSEEGLEPKSNFSKYVSPHFQWRVNYMLEPGYLRFERVLCLVMESVLNSCQAGFQCLEKWPFVGCGWSSLRLRLCLWWIGVWVGSLELQS